MAQPQQIDRPAEFTPEVAIQPVLQLTARFGVHKGIIARWRKEVGMTYPGRNLPCPEDFFSLATKHRNEWLQAHYKVGSKTILRWRREAGAHSPAAPQGTVHKIGVKSSFTAMGDQSFAGQAANFLRKYYRPVYNRSVEAKELAGTYVVGRNIMTADEMIELAIQKGYEIAAYA